MNVYRLSKPHRLAIVVAESPDAALKYARSRLPDISTIETTPLTDPSSDWQCVQVDLSHKHVILQIRT